MVSEELFWSVADAFVESGSAQPGTIMSHPCLRTATGGKNGEGEFLAMPYGDALAVKLTADRVAELIEEGGGAPFNVTGRTFKAWVLIEQADRERWEALIGEAVELAGS